MDENKIIDLRSQPRPISQKTTKEIIENRQNRRHEALKRLNQKWMNRSDQID